MLIKGQVQTYLPHFSEEYCEFIRNPSSIHNDSICNANSVALIMTMNRLSRKLKELPFLQNAHISTEKWFRKCSSENV